MSQHYDFTHRLLVDLVFGRPREHAERLLLNPMVDGFFEDLWDDHCDIDPFESAPEDEVAFVAALIRGEFDRADDELPRATRRYLDDGTDTLLVTMPPPTNATECHFCLIVFGARLRFFTFERSGDDRAMLCEWTAGEDRSHLNYGERPLSDADGFVREVVDLMES